jgi:endoglucanase
MIASYFYKTVNNINYILIFGDIIKTHIKIINKENYNHIIKMKSYIVIIGLLAIATCYPANSVVGRFGKLRVDGLHLVSASGERVQLRGMSTHGPQWYLPFIDPFRFDNCYTYESFQALAQQWNVDIIRIAMYVNE